MRDTDVQDKSGNLRGKTIAWGVCGGIGAVEAVRGLREIRRHGASVTAFATPSALSFIGETALEWASGRSAVLAFGADVPHLEPWSLVVIAPLTLNTLSKIALGIGDNSVTLLAASQLGRRAPLLLVPTMNLDLQAHPLYREYRDRLTGWGVRFLESPQEEDRIKMPSPEAVAQEVLSWLS